MGTADWDHLVDVCINELHLNSRLCHVDATDIHEVVRAEVVFSKVPLYQQLAQLLAGHPAGLLEGFARGLLAQAHGRAPSITQQNLPLQPKPQESKEVMSVRSPMLPLKRPVEQASVSAVSAASAQPADTGDAKCPTGQLAEGKSPVLVMASKPPAKPLIPGGPCENPFCGVVEAPQWRRIDKKLVCNRCGMYYHRHARFPDWSYFNGLVSKQAVSRHVVVLHRGRADGSPASSGGTAPPLSSTLQSPPPPPQQQQQQDQPAPDKATSSQTHRVRDQLLAQPQVQATSQASPRGHVTAPLGEVPAAGNDVGGCATANNAAGSGSGVRDTAADTSACNNRAGGSSGSSATRNGRAEVAATTTAATVPRPSAGPPLDQDVILRVLTRQWDHLDPATIQRVQALLEQLHQEQRGSQQSPGSEAARSPTAVSPGAPVPRSLTTVGTAAAAAGGGGSGGSSPSDPEGSSPRWVGAGRPRTGEGKNDTWVTEASPQSAQSPRSRQGRGALSHAGSAALGHNAGHLPPQQQEQRLLMARSGAAAVAVAIGGYVAAVREDGSPSHRNVGPAVEEAQTLGSAMAASGSTSNAHIPRDEQAGTKVEVRDGGSGQPPAKRMRPSAGQLPRPPPPRVLDVASGLGGQPRRPQQPQQPQEPPGRPPLLQHQKQPPQQQQQQHQEEILLSPVLAAMLQHSQATRGAAQQQQQQQATLLEVQQSLAKPKDQQQQQQQRQEAVPSSSHTASTGPAAGRPGRSLMETIAHQVAKQQELQQRAKVHQQCQQQQQQHQKLQQLQQQRLQQQQQLLQWQRELGHLSRSERAKGDADADAMEWSRVVDATGLDPVTANGNTLGASAAAGGILMRDLQQRALMQQQQQQQTKQHSSQVRMNSTGYNGADAVTQRGRGLLPAAESQGPSAPTAAARGLAGAAAYDIAGQQQLQGLSYKLPDSVAALRGATQPIGQSFEHSSLRELHSGVSAAQAAAAAAAAISQGYDAAGLVGPEGPSNVDNILELLLSRGQSGKARPGQQQQQQMRLLQPQQPDVLLEAAAAAYTPGVMSGLRQAAAGSPGMVLLPVLDLGKPPTALAF